jgi:(2Fe-2S) ferredoxin
LPRFQKHIFVCTNSREKDDPRGCCYEKNSLEIINQFKKRLKELGLTTKIRANSSGCLDACEYGPVVVVYPEQVWYGRISKDDVEEIIQQHLINNKPVEKFFIKNNKFLPYEKE